MAFAAPSLKGRALRLLSQREHSRAELERKLAQYEEEPGTLAQALDELQPRTSSARRGWSSRCCTSARARLGAARVRQELLHKGIAPEAVAEAVAGLQASEFERAREVWRTPLRRAGAGCGGRAKQMRFLARARGFGSARSAAWCAAQRGR